MGIVLGLFPLLNIDPMVSATSCFATESSTIFRPGIASPRLTRYILPCGRAAYWRSGKTTLGIPVPVTSCVGFLLIVTPLLCLLQPRIVCCANEDSKFCELISCFSSPGYWLGYVRSNLVWFTCHWEPNIKFFAESLKDHDKRFPRPVCSTFRLLQGGTVKNKPTSTVARALGPSSGSEGYFGLSFKTTASAGRFSATTHP